MEQFTARTIISASTQRLQTAKDRYWVGNRFKWCLNEASDRSISGALRIGNKMLFVRYSVADFQRFCEDTSTKTIGDNLCLFVTEKWHIIKQVGSRFVAGAALDLISPQRRRHYNGEIYCVTPAQYDGRYLTLRDTRTWLTSHCPSASLLGMVWQAVGSVRYF